MPEVEESLGQGRESCPHQGLRIGQDVAAKCSRRNFPDSGEEWLTPRGVTCRMAVESISKGRLG